MKELFADQRRYIIQRLLRPLQMTGALKHFVFIQSMIQRNDIIVLFLKRRG